VYRPHGKAIVSHVLLHIFQVFSCFVRWGTIYDCGDDDVHARLVDFARGKLLCADSGEDLTRAQKYAVLSHWLVLDTTGMCHVISPSKAMEREQEQIAKHMRVCVSIGDEHATIRGITPSEPILSEAASLVMRDESFRLADALADVLNHHNINPGDQAELIISAFFTWACDKVVSAAPCATRGQFSRYFSVTELFKSLFSNSILPSIMDSPPSLSYAKGTGPTFGQTFGRAYMHFTHFIKPQEQKLLARPYLPFFMARGAAVFGANSQRGVDAVYPYLYNELELSHTNVGFILIQVKKNDIPLNSRSDIFRNMDPFECGLLQDSDCVDGKFPIPIIRIVFALCHGPSTQSGVAQQCYTSPSEGSSSCLPGKRGKRGEISKFTSYDFWCSGIDPNIIEPVKEGPERWGALIEKADVWKTVYKDAPNGSGDTLHAQYPACGSHNAHFDTWAIGCPGQE